MLRSLLRSSQLFTQMAVAPSCRVNYPSRTERQFKDLTLPDLVNEKYMRKLVRTKLPGSTLKAQRGLYHGKKITTGHDITYSDKKTKRRFDPNVFKKTFFSNVLGKTVTTNVTTKTLKCIRKYGGFDNYILLTKPQNMQSMFGEYLRKIMLEKINNPSIDLDHARIFGTTPDVKSKRKRRIVHDGIFMPKEIRHKDHTMDYFRGFNEMSKEELSLVS
jgi:large subunit ribosomal protein L28